MSKVNYPLLMRIACVECYNPHNNHCSQETKESSNSNEHFASMTIPDFSTSLISNFISFSLLRISPRIQALLDCWALYKLEDCKRLHVGKMDPSSNHHLTTNALSPIATDHFSSYTHQRNDSGHTTLNAQESCISSTKTLEMNDDALLQKVELNDNEKHLPKYDDKDDSTIHANDAITKTYTPEEEKRLVRKLDMRIIPLFCAFYFVDFLDRSNIGNAT